VVSYCVCTIVKIGPGNACDAVEPEAANGGAVANQHQLEVVEQGRRIVEGADEKLGQHLELQSPSTCVNNSSRSKAMCKMKDTKSLKSSR
jgi:hypothetical protein